MSKIPYGNSMKMLSEAKSRVCLGNGEDPTAKSLTHIPERDFAKLSMHSKGRTVPVGNDWVQEFFLKDHLGNTRVVFGDYDGDQRINPDPSAQHVPGVVSGDLRQVVEGYYPFGLAFNGFQNTAFHPENQYLYNGKELQDELGLGWYDYGARWYDGSIARWNGVDAVASLEDYVSPFVYVSNNPLRNIDPDGNTRWDIIKGVAAAVLDNTVGAAYDAAASAVGSDSRSNWRGYVAKYAGVEDASDFNTGQDIGDTGTAVVGAALESVGTVAMAKGGVTTAVGGGLVLSGAGAPAGGPVVAVGVAETTFGAGAKVAGSAMRTNGAQNLVDQKGRVYAKPGTYAPNRKLPRDKHGRPIPDSEASGRHTQLGKKEGRRGTYTEGREFDSNGNPVKDIHFTDHGRPKTHPNPHEHKHLPNKTGGTPRRGKAEPLEIKD